LAAVTSREGDKGQAEEAGDDDSGSESESGSGSSSSASSEREGEGGRKDAAAGGDGKLKAPNVEGLSKEVRQGEGIVVCVNFCPFFSCKERKRVVKEFNRERRKNKTPKHVKKRRDKVAKLNKKRK
jgi:hypothetical protein